MSEPVAIKWTVEIRKTVPERRLVFGWAAISKTTDGRAVFDLQGDHISPSELEDCAYDFTKNARLGGAMHTGPADAVLVESMAFTDDKLAALGIAKGTVPTAHWVGFEVSPAVWERVKSGELRMFSIEGTGTREAVPAEAAA